MEYRLDEFGVKVLLHLYIYGPDTPKLLCRRLLGERSQIDVAVLEQVLDNLVNKGLVKRMQIRTIPKNAATSSIKPWIKVKAKANEVRKHGQYYELTKEGKRIAREIKNLFGKALGNFNDKRHFITIFLSLKPLHIYILFHLRKTCSDYAKSIAKILRIPIENVVLALEQLEQLGLIERVHGSAIKRTDAKLKLSHEVRKHHTYYKLSRDGEKLLRDIKNHGLLSKCLTLSTGHSKVHQLLLFLKEAEYEHIITIARILSMKINEAQELIDKLIELGLIVETKPKILKMKHRRAKPKKETRCLHKYYKLTRLGELLTRYSLERNQI